MADVQVPIDSLDQQIGADVSGDTNTYVHTDEDKAQEEYVEPNTSDGVLEGDGVDAEVQTDVSLEERLSQVEAQVEEYRNQYLRAVADHKNYKRRTETEREELKKHAGASLLLKLLPVIDDFERALENAPSELVDTSWGDGMRMIAEKLNTILQSEGVTPIEALDQDFDPNMHHAVLYEEVDGKDGKVVAELQKGYMLHDRVLRPTMVKVGKC